ncbi:retinoic acid receptor gamma-like isoform X2 [Babylonia areolata]
MKDITNICSQDEAVTVGEVSVLSPPCRHQTTPDSFLTAGQPARSPDSSGPRESSPFGGLPSGEGFLLSLQCSAAPPTSSRAFYPPTPVSQVPSPSGFVPATTTGTFMSSPSPVSTFVPSPPSLSSLSHAPSPSTSSFTPSPSTHFAASPPAAFTFTPSPAKPVTPEASPLSPPVTIKCEEDSSFPGSPQCRQSKPHLGLQAGRPASPGKTVSGSLLPPCKICLDKASGFHYGLNTCEACKGFFRRSLKRGVSYVCARSNNCDVTGEKRNMCGYCRYQKCIALGMSKKAIKTGRYTHAKRTKDTLEIKRLMRAESPTQEEEEIDFEAMIAQVVKAHDDFVISSTKVPTDVIKEKQTIKLEELNLNMKHFGKMTQVSPDEHQEIFNMTGIDIDNRRELMNFHVKNSERWIRGYISFAKKLPGFRDLSLNDQANLVKYARIEFWFLGSFPGYNAELGVAVMPNGRCFTRREMCNVWRNKYIDVSFDLSQKLQKLQVSAEEMIIIKAICLMAGDRCSFEDPDKVSKIQWRMIRCLQYLLKKRLSTHSEFVSIFSKVFICLTDLRDLNEAEYQTIQSTQLYQLFTEHPLIMEMLPY